MVAISEHPNERPTRATHVLSLHPIDRAARCPLIAGCSIESARDIVGKRASIETRAVKTEHPRALWRQQAGSRT